jgi:hypothetical protein
MMLQENIDFACGQEGVDCAAIRPGGVCYEPDTLQGHAAYAMNLYFQSNGQHAFDCDFGQTGVLTTADPSKIIFILVYVNDTCEIMSLASYIFHGRFWRMQIHVKRTRHIRRFLLFLCSMCQVMCCPC